MKNKNKVILQIKKGDEGVSVTVNCGTVLDVVIGIAETIQLIMEETEQSKENILEDINKVLEILEKEEEN